MADAERADADGRAPPPIPRAAIIVPAWNAGGTIEATLRSALAQSEARVEVIVVDDGSTDDTLEIVRAVAKRDARLRVVEQASSGPSIARNRGTKEARADYLCFLDADDLIDIDKIATQCNVLDASRTASVVYSRTVEFRGELDGQASESATAATRDVPTRTSGADMVAALLRGEYLIGFGPGAALVRRAEFEAVGGFRDLEPLVEDVDLWTRMAFAGCQFVHDPESVMYRRMRPGTRSTHVLDFNRGWCATLTWLTRRIDGVPTTCRAALLRNTRYRHVLVASLYAQAKDATGTRRYAARSLRFARSPGEILESLRHLIAPTSAARHAQSVAD